MLPSSSPPVAAAAANSKPSKKRKTERENEAEEFAATEAKFAEATAVQHHPAARRVRAPGGPEIGIVVVLDAELEGLKLAFNHVGTEWPAKPEPTRGFNNRPGTHLYWQLEHGGFKLVVCKTDNQGQAEMFSAVNHLVSVYRVRYLVLIGVSGALGSSRIGDVILADDIDYYAHRGDVVDVKEEPAAAAASSAAHAAAGFAAHRFGGKVFNVSDEFAQAGSQFRYTDEELWKQWHVDAHNMMHNTIGSENDASNKLFALSTSFAPNGPQFYVGPIATGHDVVKAEFEKGRLKGRNRHLLAVDTESGGFAHQIGVQLRELRDPPKYLVFRGISDMAGEDNKKDMEGVVAAKGSWVGTMHGNLPPFQVVATYNATRMLLAFMAADKFQSNTTGIVDEYIRLIARSKEASDDLAKCKESALIYMGELAAAMNKPHVYLADREERNLLVYRQHTKDANVTVKLLRAAIKEYVKSAAERVDIEDYVANEKERGRKGTATLSVESRTKLANKRFKPADGSSMFQVDSSASTATTETEEDDDEEGDEGDI